MGSNLVSNAIKYSSENNQDANEIGLYQKDVEIIFVVKKGMGFDMNYSNKLFGAYQPLHKLRSLKARELDWHLRNAFSRGMAEESGGRKSE